MIGLLGAGKFKMAAGGALLAVLAAGYWSWSSRGDKIDDLNAANARMRASLETAVQANDELRATLAGVRERHERTLSRLAESQRVRAALTDRTATIREETRDDEDGPVAPVLRGTLERLRDTRTGDPGGDESRDGPATDSATTD